jgi:hypothetical protein
MNYKEKHPEIILEELKKTTKTLTQAIIKCPEQILSGQKPTSLSSELPCPVLPCSPEQFSR